MNSKSKARVPLNLIAFWLMIASAWQVLAVDPIVSNVQVKQREGSRLVDITYDVVDPDSPTLTVYLKVSPDGGRTWKGPVELVSGDVGEHISPGTAKKLVWDAGKEMANHYGTKFRYRIGATDQWAPPQGMALIPVGPFQMGDDRVFGRVHTVMVSAFAVDKWEVSIELWKSVAEWGNLHGYDLTGGSSFGANHPVYRVNWYDVVKWCNARSEKEGKVVAYYEDGIMTQVYRSGDKVPAGVNWHAGYRLPTESEWEKAARGGVAGKLYPWGTDEKSPTLANWGESNKGKTMPIGSYGANGYGLYDTAGNVWEWNWNWYGWDDQSAQTDPRGPSSPTSAGPRRVVRGGSWDGISEYCRVADSYSSFPYNRYDDFIGFRAVLPPGQP